MRLRWSARAVADLNRLRSFVEPSNPAVAARIAVGLVEAAEHLAATPRLGFRLWRYAPREMRRVIAGQYEIRYGIRDKVVVITRLWHTREDRQP